MTNKAEKKIQDRILYAMAELEVADQNIRYHEDRLEKLRGEIKFAQALIKTYKRIKEKLIKLAPRGMMRQYEESKKENKSHLPKR